MDFVTPFIKPSIDAVKAGLRAARHKLGKRKYEGLLAATIAELLKEHPDLDAAEANIAAAEAVGATPDKDLLRAKSMLTSARTFHRARFAKAAKRRAGPRKGRKTRKRK
jgi:hypothetical protein